MYSVAFQKQSKRAVAALGRLMPLLVKWIPAKKHLSGYATYRELVCARTSALDFIKCVRENVPDSVHFSGVKSSVENPVLMRVLRVPTQLQFQRSTRAR